MFKILSKVLFFLAFMTLVKAEILNEIKVEGNQRISEATIIVLGKIEIGTDYNDNNLNDVLKNLYNSNFFSDIDLNLSNGKLIIKVLENPIIEDIQITGIKSKAFTEQLYENISLKNRKSLQMINC